MASSNIPVFQYAIHITFINLNKKRIPYHIDITSLETLKTTTLGLKMEGIKMSYEEMICNLKNVNGFPRPTFVEENYIQTYPLENAIDSVNTLLSQDFWSEDAWNPIFGTTDRETYDFINSIYKNFQSIILLENSTFGQDISLGVAMCYGNADQPTPNT